MTTKRAARKTKARRYDPADLSDPWNPNRRPPIDWSRMTEEEHRADIRKRMTTVEVTDEYLRENLQTFEQRYGVRSEVFFEGYSRGEFHEHEFLEWASLCEWALARAAGR